MCYHFRFVMLSSFIHTCILLLLFKFLCLNFTLTCNNCNYFLNSKIISEGLKCCLVLSYLQFLSYNRFWRNCLFKLRMVIFCQHAHIAEPNERKSHQKSIKFFYQDRDDPQKSDCHRIQWFLQRRWANTMFDAWREQFDDQWTDSFLQ